MDVALRRPYVATRELRQRSSMLLHDNGLLLASLGLFGAFFSGMIFAGAATYNQQLHEHGSRSG